MNPDGPLAESPAVRHAMQRLAGRRGKHATPKPADDLERSYLAQTGRRQLTPAQRRRAAKAARKAGSA